MEKFQELVGSDDDGDDAPDMKDKLDSKDSKNSKDSKASKRRRRRRRRRDSKTITPQAACIKKEDQDPQPRIKKENQDADLALAAEPSYLAISEHQATCIKKEDQEPQPCIKKENQDGDLALAGELPNLAISEYQATFIKKEDQEPQPCIKKENQDEDLALAGELSDLTISEYQAMCIKKEDQEPQPRSKKEMQDSQSTRKRCRIKRKKQKTKTTIQEPQATCIKKEDQEPQSRSKKEMQEPKPSCSDYSGQNNVTWTKQEKYALLQGLRAYGSYDIARIKRRLPKKTPQQIEKIIADYKEQAFKQYEEDEKKKKHEQEPIHTPTANLSNWATLLENQMGNEELRTEMATAVRVIAEMEDIPPAVLTENIDFRAAYHLLADALEGKPLPQLDEYTADLFNKAMEETAQTSETFISNSNLENILNNLEISKDSEPLQSDLDAAAAVANNLATQSNNNPLNLSLDHLKPAP